MALINLEYGRKVLSISWESNWSVHHSSLILEKVLANTYWCFSTPQKILVVLTTEWLPWLQTNWGGSGYQPKSYFTTDNLRICELSTGTILPKKMMLFMLSQVVTISARWWLLLHALWYKQDWCDPFRSGYKLQDHGCKIVWEASSVPSTSFNQSLYRQFWNSTL